ncbi:hypothetical protein MCOR25_003516 [Pyricularia grisea]|nr:hypothetical protein MCOR25_003516 [Pyricularia grisea]
MNFFIRPLGRSGSTVPKTPCLRRMAEMAGFESTAAKAAPRGRFFSTTSTPASQQRPDPNRKPSGYHYSPTQPLPGPGANTGAKPRRRPPYLLLSIGALLGSVYAVYLVKLLTLPPATAGSELDKEILAEIKLRGDKLIEEVRRHTVNPDSPEWITVCPTDFSVQDTQIPGILVGPLSSSAGLPYHRLLLNVETGSFCAVIYIGDGVCGWPTVAHGGATATILQSVMAVAAGLVRRNLPEGQEGEKVTRLFDPAHVALFNIEYRKRLETSRFYFVYGAVDDNSDVVEGVRKNIVSGAVLDVMPHDAEEKNIMVTTMGKFLALVEK